MSAMGLGDSAVCGTLFCDTLIATNDPSADPHKITGDLEVTGNLKVDGGVEIDASGIKGLKLNSRTGVNQVNIDMNDNTNTWSISADASSNSLQISHILNSAASGVIVATFDYNPSTGAVGCQLPADPLILLSLPTSAPAFGGAVWNNAGVLNVTP